MMDLTLLYYTANVIPEPFAKRIRSHLCAVAGPGLRIISVSQKPLEIDFGHNICVGDIGRSTYNIYKQILIGAKEARTDYVACCEDDSLYTNEHFSYRPPLDTFAYNVNRWNLDQSGVFFKRNRAGMCMCIAPRKLLIQTLEERFAKFPECPVQREDLRGFGEPGRYEHLLGLTPVKMETFQTTLSTITISHHTGLGGRRKILPNDEVTDKIEFWGYAKDVWKRFVEGPKITVKPYLRKNTERTDLHGYDTICANLRDIYLWSNNEDIKTKARIALRMAKSMHNKLVEYKTNKESPVIQAERLIWEKAGIKVKDSLPFTPTNSFDRSDLANLFGQLGYKRGAEIGVYEGDYSKVLCENIPGLELLCVDPWKRYAGRETDARMERKYQRAQNKLKDYNVTFVRSTSQLAAAQLPIRSLDFVYIDALHDFDNVMLDIILWTPKVRTDGIVAGHDFFNFYRGGVIDAVQAYTRAHGIQNWYVTTEQYPSWFWVAR